MKTTSLLRTLPLLLATLLSVPAALAQQQPQPQSLKMIKLSAGLHNIRAQVADTESQRTTGLMHRPSMPTNEGMLFIFPVASQQCFWMKNTLLPLSAAFVADDGTIVNIEDMKPQTENPHCSTRPVRYVLEMNKGWFATRSLAAGSRLKGEPFKP